MIVTTWSKWATETQTLLFKTENNIIMCQVVKRLYPVHRCKYETDMIKFFKKLE